MQTLSVVVCDDEKEILEHSCSLLNEYAQEQGIILELHSFEKAFDCLNYLCAHQADLLVLDIFLKDDMGTKLAVKVREFNPHIKLVFLSTSNEFATESFEVNASYYLIKPLTKEKLSKALERCALFEVKHFVTIDTGHQLITLDPKAVILLEVNNKYTYIHTASGVITELCPLAKLAEYFKEPDFCMIHRSFIINFNHVKEVEDEFFVMKNGFRAPIRTRGTKAVKEQYMQWLFEHL